MRLIFISASLLLPLLLSAQKKEKFKLPNLLNEVSGMVYHTADSVWYLNDGGHPAALYLTDEKGNLREIVPVPAAVNRDWEDMTRDKSGNFYIGDFGNNRNKRQDLTIYIFNPRYSNLDSITFFFPDQYAFPPAFAERNFDTEALFWHRGYLHLFSKSTLGNGNYITRHYRLRARPGPQTAELRSEKLLPKRVVTAAAVSSDGSTVALLSYRFKLILGIFPFTRTSVFTFRDFTDDDFLSGDLSQTKVRKCIFPTQYESLDFCGNNRVIIASERTAFITPRGKKVKLK